MGLYKKFILSFALMSLLTVGFFSWQDFRFHNYQINTTRQGKVELLTEVINNGLKSIMLEGRGKKEFQKFIENLIAEDISAIRIVTQEGIILSSTIPGEIGRSMPEKTVSIYSSKKDVSVFTHAEDGKKVFSKIVLIKNDLMCQKCHGKLDHIRGILDVEFSTVDTDRRLVNATGAIMRNSVLMFMALIISVAVLGHYLIRKPISELIESAIAMPGGSPGLNTLAGREDEVGLLARHLQRITSDIGNKVEEIGRYHAERDLSLEKMASLGELAAAVAHEIKNPLAGISGALQVLAEDFPEDSPRKEISKEILEEIERLDRSVKDLIIFARPPDMSLIHVDINAVVEKVAGALRPRAAKSGVIISVTSDTISEIKVDPEQMEKAFSTIALFSLQSMQKGGRLEITLKDRPEEGSVEIAISDTGAGMSETQAKNIFKPFFSTKNSGSGLGLAIACNIIEGHGGSISVSSRPGSGTAYLIKIPRAR